MGCTSAKQVSAVPSDEEGRGKNYSNGDLYSGQSAASVFSTLLAFTETFTGMFDWKINKLFACLTSKPSASRPLRPFLG